MKKNKNKHTKKNGEKTDSPQSQKEHKSIDKDKNIQRRDY